MTDDEMNAIRARLDAACPGPWTGMTIHRWLDGTCLTIVHQNENGRTTIAATLLPAYSDPDTALLLLHARADIEALIAEVERLRAAFRALPGDLLPVSEAIAMRDKAVAKDRAAVVAYLRERQPGWPAGSGGHADAIERGEHNRGGTE